MSIFSFLIPKYHNKIIICIHGFGRTQSDEYLELKNYLKKYKFSIPMLYDIYNENDDNYEEWLNRAEEVIDLYKNTKKEIILIGYSMGGVIATNFATKANVKKLILLAPAFEYITLSNAIDVVSKIFKTKKEPNDSIYPELPENFTLTFRTLVESCKDKISDIDVPTLIIHGTSDPTIKASTSKKYYKKIKHNKKHLVFLQDVDHHILKDNEQGIIAMKLIKSFIEDEI
ncbi:MAG: alpha/beta hydrolase [Anaerorhabdus sp.]